jgi:ribosomal protein L11 methyltransferase
VGGTVVYGVSGARGELPQRPEGRAVAGDALVEISTTEVSDDWDERWKQFHRPVLIEAPPQAAAKGQRLVSLRVRPPWEAASAPGPAAIREIVIDPGQAFGTGAHASTRMCLELLLELAANEPARPPVIDVGTGSGVLAIAAAVLGFRPVIGLDHEQESVDAARENAAVNGVEIEARRFDLRREALPRLDDGDVSGQPPVLLANLLRPLLLELAASISTAPAHLIASGLLRAEVDEVAGAFTDRVGLRERERRVSGEWAAVRLSAV